MDWSLFHSLNGALRRHDGGQDTAQIFNAWAIFALVGVAGAIWFVARPGGSQRSKLAALSSAASAALALLLNVAVAQLWWSTNGRLWNRLRRRRSRDRPARGAPARASRCRQLIPEPVESEYSEREKFGLALLLGAAAVAIDRIFVGVHYPVDVTASLFVGLGSALAVTTVGRAYVSWGVRQLSKLSDPVVASALRVGAPILPR